VCLLYASLEELGCDPNVERFVDTTRKVDDKGNHTLTFVYKVGERYYKTLHAIADYSSLCITGRATRVWLVIQVRGIDDLRPVDGANTTILKDYWLDVGTDSEGTTQKNLFADLAGVAAIFNSPELQASSALPAASPASTLGLPPTVFSNDEREDIVNCFHALREEEQTKLRASLLTYHKHFLTVEAESEGVQSKQVATECFRVKDFFTVNNYNPPQPATAAGADPIRSDALETGCQVIHVSPAVVERTLTAKRRCLINFKEPCKALHNLKDLKEAMPTIRDCIRGILFDWHHAIFNS
jgi:hypothetical protein